MLGNGPAHYVGGEPFVLSVIAAAAENLAVDVIDCVRTRCAEWRKGQLRHVVARD